MNLITLHLLDRNSWRGNVWHKTWDNQEDSSGGTDGHIGCGTAGTQSVTDSRVCTLCCVYCCTSSAEPSRCKSIAPRGWFHPFITTEFLTCFYWLGSTNPITLSSMIHIKIQASEWKSFEFIFKQLLSLFFNCSVDAK